MSEKTNRPILNLVETNNKKRKNLELHLILEASGLLSVLRKLGLNMTKPFFPSVERLWVQWKYPNSLEHTDFGGVLSFRNDILLGQ